MSVRRNLSAEGIFVLIVGLIIYGIWKCCSFVCKESVSSGYVDANPIQVVNQSQIRSQPQQSAPKYPVMAITKNNKMPQQQSPIIQTINERSSGISHADQQTSAPASIAQQSTLFTENDQLPPPPSFEDAMKSLKE